MLKIIFNRCVCILSWKNSKQPQDVNKPHPKNNVRGKRENTESDPGGPECGEQIQILQIEGSTDLL